jgi:hypothetical protein
MRTDYSLSGEKLQRGEAGHSLSPDAEVKNAYAFMARCSIKHRKNIDISE